MLNTGWNLTASTADLSLPMFEPFDIPARTRVVFGIGAVDRLGPIVGELSADRVLLVTDPGLVQAGHVDRALASLRAAARETVVFSDVAENPTTEHVDAAVAMARDFRPQILVGLGGGSAMDTARGANFVYCCGGPLEKFWGRNKATGPLLPSIAIPTTAGTGSEAQSFALIANAVTHQKMACGDGRAAATVAILDPNLGVTLPQRSTAIVGIDAFAHALESLVTRARTAWSVRLARQAAELIGQALPRVIHAGDDLEARAAMLLGSFWAGAAIEASMLGAAHSLANPLTAHFGITHGLAVGIMLPTVLRYNAAIVSSAYDQIAQTIFGPVAAGQGAEKLGEFIQNQLRAAGLPTSLADYRIPPQQIPELALEAAKQWTLEYNPRSASVDDLAALYLEACV